MRMTAEEVVDRMAALPGWALARDGAAIRREFAFANFAEAWAFMGHVAALAEEQDHHPDWSNVYNRVVIELTSHDAGGLTMRDFQLAEGIDAL